MKNILVFESPHFSLTLFSLCFVSLSLSVSLPPPSLSQTLIVTGLVEHIARVSEHLDMFMR